MDRRTFLGSLAGGLLTVPFGAEAQPAGTVPLVGFMEPGARSANRHFADAFRQGLRDLGYTEGQNIRIEERWGDGKTERFPDLAAELVRLKVAVMVVGSGPAAMAAKKVTTTVPIVFVGVPDPVGIGLVDSLARPGGNVTGFSAAWSESFAGKWLELLKEAVPRTSRVAVLLGNPGLSARVISLREMQTAAATLGVKLLEIGVQNASDFDPAFATMVREGAGGLIVVPDPLVFSQRARIVELAATRRLPAMYAFGDFARAGGLMAYGPSLRGMFRRAATYVDRILKGAKPADLPVEQPTEFELVINLKTAKALRLTIPPSLLLRADQVIQ